MHFSTVLSGLGLMASVASAAPQVMKKRASTSSDKVVVYWGQTAENSDLTAYCSSTSGVDVLLLAFLFEYSNGATIPHGTIGPDCAIDSSGNPSNCDQLAQQITTCQAAGVKVLISMGGASGDYGLQSESQAQQIGQYLWEAYGNGGATTNGVARPFGSVTVDGFDYDIEVNDYSQYYQYMIAQLRSNFGSDSSRTYWVTGAPQCPLPEPNMGVIIQNSVFDKLWIQYYNNNPTCSAGFNGAASFNFDSWVSFIATTPSANAKLYVGLPASTSASGLAAYYLSPSELVTLVNEVSSQSTFEGIMLWDAGDSDENVNNGCTYAQEVKAVFLTGNACINGPVSSPGNPTTPPASTPTTTTVATPAAPTTLATSTKAPAPTTTSTSTSTGGTVPQWSQCGGQGYTGPTQCESPYTCVAEGSWWSSCQ